MEKKRRASIGRRVGKFEIGKGFNLTLKIRRR
jgi:hypothetical protein